MQYIKPLDGLRAVAVIFVIMGHWLWDNPFVKQIPFGEIGVDIFFVLSGFLITSILLNNRRQYHPFKDVSRLKLIKLFIMRRTLRIFPIYYITIILMFLVASKTGTNIKEDFIYYVTYTTNIKYYIQGHWDGMLSPLWSLAVEEQFYLIWPWIILFTGNRYLFPVIIGTLLLGIASNFFFNDFGFILTPTCFDAFGIGAFIAYDNVYKKNILKNNLGIGFLISLVLIAACYFTYDSRIIPLRTVIAVSTGFLIVYLLQARGIIYKFLSTSVLVFIGKISYGIYLLHNIVPWIFENIIRKLNIYGMNIYLPKYLLMTIEFILLVTVARLSWILIEKRINNLKKHFSYNLLGNKEYISGTTNKKEMSIS